MTNAPERIWADANRQWSSVGWSRSNEFVGDVEYVRADIVQALTAERDGLLRCVTDNHVALCRAEAAEAERDRYRKALERIAGVKGPYSHPFPESNEGYGSFAIVTAREALKGESHE